MLYLDIVGDPFDEVGGILVLHVEHLLVDFLHAHATTEHRRHRQVSEEKKAITQIIMQIKIRIK